MESTASWIGMDLTIPPQAGPTVPAHRSVSGPHSLGVRRAAIPRPRTVEGLLHDVASAAAFDDGRIVLDIFCSAGAAGTFAAQALYHRDNPFTQISLNKGGSLSWGGLLQHRGTWLFAQGWDAPAGVRELHFYRSARGDSTPLG